VQLAETHISWVLLTGEVAYKIKKPVDLGFLDFSTLALRQQACEDEVRLNRRLAEEFYLGVVPITGSPMAPRINAQGESFEYAVKMRQFPPEATLDRMDERGELGVAQIDQLATRLAQFHLAGCPSAPAESPWGEPDTIARPVAENFQLLNERLVSADDVRRLARLQSWCDAEHERLAPLMRERKNAGMVRECHGDLHLGNLAWVNGRLIIFDCIEFSPALRWIDVISEVAFCYMDLLHRQHRDLAFRFLNAWLEVSGDYRGVALLRYYTVYRAMVRAKVAALRAGQVAEGNAAADRDEAGVFLRLAEELTRPTPPQLWITHGLSGCGKTTLSQSVLQEHGMVRLRSDVERKRLAGMAASERSGSGIETGLYTQDASRRAYQHLASLTEILLDDGWPVIVDAAFLMRWQRDLFREIALRRELRFRILDIQVDHAMLRERIGLRAAQGSDASEADLRVLQHQIESEQPLCADELSKVTRMSGTDFAPN
jgi:aminoglycoside phosphotransferase family enzyme/gluconate kinase